LNEQPFTGEPRDFDHVNTPADVTPRHVLLAGIGAVALAYNTAGETFMRLVDKGQEVQTEVQNRTEGMKRQNAGTRDRVDHFIRTGMDALLNTLNFPSKADVDTINVKLNMLARKMDDIQLRATMQSQPGVHDTPTETTGDAGSAP
jgi:polyhydroxyalkanoate synthesis regulator phasin